MQLAQDNTKIESNVKTETHTFGIKQENMSFLMGILTKMYANPIQTLTQEYISNARDANREVRQSRRIEITAPSRFAPNMIIRDFGPSLDPERIRDVFLYYGSSTKRATNTQTGGFGIGGKSAWAYTDSFTITAWHEGMKRTYIAHKSNGTGNLDMISESESNEPTGTAIEIAINPMDVPRFRNAILRTVFFWRDNEMPVLKGFDASELKVFETKPSTDTFKEIKIYADLPQVVTAEKRIAIIDGIPYPMRIAMPKLDKLIRQDYTLILNTGDVAIAPNREEFVDDKQARDFFAAIDDSVSTKVTSHINSEIARHSGLKDGLKQYVLLYRTFDFKGSFKGYNIDYHGLWVTDPKTTGYHNHLELGIIYDTYRNKFRRQDFNSIPLDSIEHVYFDDMPNEANVKKVWRVKKVLNAGKIGRAFRMLKAEHTKVIADLDAKPLSSIDASDYTVQRQAKAAVKKLEICCHYFDGSLNPTQVQLAGIALTVVYASLNNTDGLYAKRNSTEQRDVISYINNKMGHKFAFIADGYIEKIANNVNFVKFEDFIKNLVLTSAEIKTHCKREFEYEFRHLSHLKPIVNEVKDPSIKYAIDLLTFNTQIPSVPKLLIDKAHATIVEFEKQKATLKKFEERYPMLYRLLDSDGLTKKQAFKKDVVTYMNRKYKEYKLQCKSNAQTLKVSP